MGDFMKPTQTKPATTQTDPFTQLRPQQQFTEAMLRGGLGRARGGEIGSPYAGPNAGQLAALNAQQGYLNQARPAFTQGAQELERVAAGAYLDPTQSAPYQQFKQSQMALAPMLFQDVANQIAGRTSARGSYTTSARRLQQARGAGEIGGSLAQKVAGAGWGQYGRERGLQEAAAARGEQLAPSLSQQVFGAQETLRGAQQAANLEQLRGQLQAMGMEGNQIESLLKYLSIAAGTPVPYVKGPSPWQQVNTGLSSATNIAGSPAGTPAGSPYGGTIYAPSSGWATPRYQE
jgi:hypothetical protein